MRLAPLATGLVALTGLALTASAQVPGVPLDLNSTLKSAATQIDNGRFPSLMHVGDTPQERLFDSFVELGGAYYYAGTTPALGTELYRTDGTALGTFLVDDTTPGPGSTGPCMLLAFKGDLYFVDSDQPQRTLYRMDGATGIVTAVAVVGDPNNDYADARMVALQDRFLFVGKDAEGYELWSSDGTAAGTGIVKAISPGAGDTRIRHLLANDTGTFALFVAEDANGNAAVWRTDGTDAGTFALAATDRFDVPTFPETAWTARFGSDMLFVRHDAAGNGFLERTDGTLAGTQLLRMFGPAPGFPSLIDLGDGAMLGGELFFSALDLQTGTEPWRTDGTSAGTQLLADLRTGFASSVPSGFAVGGGKLFFVATPDVGGKELNVFDGVNVTTLDLSSGPSSSFVTTSVEGAQLAGVAGGVYFATRSGVLGEELYFSDGTLAGTQQLTTPPASGPANKPHCLTPLPNGEILCAMRSDGAEQGIHRATPSGVSLVETLSGKFATANSAFNSASRRAPDVWFAWADLGQGATVVRLTPDGAEALVDPTAVQLTSGFAHIEDSGQVVVAGSVAQGPFGFFLVDETTGALQSLPVPVGQLDFGLPYHLSRSANGYLLHALVVDSQASLFINMVIGYDASFANPQVLSTATSTPPVETPGGLVFVVNDSLLGNEFYGTDGTLAGTQLLFESAPGSAGLQKARLLPALDLAVLLYNATGQPEQLALSDGTPAGTQQVPLGVLTLDGGVDPVGYQGELYFVATDAAVGKELFAYDPQSQAVRLVADVLPGAADGAPHRLTVSEHGVVFAATTGLGDLEFFETTGSGANQVSSLAGSLTIGAVSQTLVAAEAVYAIVEVAAGHVLVAIDAGATTVVSTDVPEILSPFFDFEVFDGGVFVVGLAPEVGIEPFHFPIDAARAEPFGGEAVLTAMPPVLGGTTVVHSAKGPVPVFSILAMSGSVKAPLDVPALAAELLWLDPNGLQVVGMFAGGNWSHAAQVPSSPALLGAHATLQALYLGASLPGELSNPVALTLGL